jgi:hypothetical protein
MMPVTGKIKGWLSVGSELRSGKLKY